MRFDKLTRMLLREMAIEKESDVIYLSQMLNQPRSDSFYQQDYPVSYKMLTHKSYPKLLRKKFASKIKYPVRVIIDDIGDGNGDSYVKNDRSISTQFEPLPGVITFILTTMNVGAADAPTPFMVGHNVGHTIQTLTRYGHSDNNGNLMQDQYGCESAFESVVYETVDAIVKAHPQYPWMRGVRQLEDLGERQERQEIPDWSWGSAYVEILTPNFSGRKSEGFGEWVPNLVGLYMMFGKIKFRVGSAAKIEQFLDKQLSKWVGKNIAL